MAVDKAHREQLTKKARRKYLSARLAMALTRVARTEKMLKKYQQSIACSSWLYSDGLNLKTRFYCFNRWCPTCQSIKMAIMINKYLPLFERIQEEKPLYFVTLTRPTCTEWDLPGQIELMGKTWRKVMDLMRKSGVSYRGLRKSECKVSKGRYHFHYHIIVEGREAAKLIWSNWLRIDSATHWRGQDVTRVDGLEAGLLELFKYSTKLTTKQKKEEIPMTPTQLDAIFTAMYKKRVFQGFGGLKFDENLTENTPEKIKAAIGDYTWVGSDWVHTEYGHYLADFKPNAEDNYY